MNDETRVAAPVRYVRSNMGLIHAVAASGDRAKCGTVIRDSWEPVEVAEWSSEPNVCRSCDDVLMARGRRAAQ